MELLGNCQEDNEERHGLLQKPFCRDQKQNFGLDSFQLLKALHTNNMYGDYMNVTLSGSGATFTGGKDTLKGGDGTVDSAADNNMFGDASGVAVGDGATYTGGNDTITGGTNAENLLWLLQRGGL